MNPLNFDLKTLTPQQTQFLIERRGLDHAPQEVADDFNALFNPPAPISLRQVTSWMTRYRRLELRNNQYIASQPSDLPSSDRFFPLESPGQPKADSPFLHSRPAPLVPSQPQQTMNIHRQHQTPAGLASVHQRQNIVPPVQPTIYPHLSQPPRPTSTGQNASGFDANLWMSPVEYSAANQTPAFSQPSSPTGVPGTGSFPLPNNLGSNLNMNLYPGLPSVGPGTGLPSPTGPYGQPFPSPMSSSTMDSVPSVGQSSYPSPDYGMYGGLSYPLGHPSASSVAMQNPDPMVFGAGSSASASACPPHAYGAPAGPMAGYNPGQQVLTSPVPLPGNGQPVQALARAGMMTPRDASAFGGAPRSQTARDPPTTTDRQGEISVNLLSDNSRSIKLKTLPGWNEFTRKFSPSLDQLSNKLKLEMRRDLIADLAAFGKVPARDSAEYPKISVFAPGCTPVEAKGVDQNGVWYIGKHNDCGRTSVHRHNWNGGIIFQDGAAAQIWRQQMAQLPSSSTERVTEDRMMKASIAFTERMRDAGLADQPMIPRTRRSARTARNIAADNGPAANGSRLPPSWGARPRKRSREEASLDDGGRPGGRPAPSFPESRSTQRAPVPNRPPDRPPEPPDLSDQPGGEQAPLPDQSALQAHEQAPLPDQSVPQAHEQAPLPDWFADQPGGELFDAADYLQNLQDPEYYGFTGIHGNWQGQDDLGGDGGTFGGA